jgi:ComF family protein
MVKYVVDLVRSLLSPPHCAYCYISIDERQPLCTACLQCIQPIVTYNLALTRKDTLMVEAVSAYQEPLRSLILAKNYGNKVASRQLAHVMWYQTSLSYRACDIFVPIPLHWRRYAWRGFNQAEVIASDLAHAAGAQCLSLLQRQRATMFQAHLNIEERATNVKEVFMFKGDAKSITGKHLVLVDDLMTTGATLREAAKILLPLQPASLRAVVACRVI